MRKPLPIASIVASLITEHPDVVGPDNRSIMFGRFEMMEQAIAALSGKGETQEYEIESSHPEVPSTNYTVGRNPDLLVSLDSQSKLHGTGTHNCITCSHFVANQLCPQWHSHGREVELDQNTVEKLSNGGCSMHDLLPGLNDGQQMPNPVFDKIVDTVLEDDLCLLYKNGQITGKLDRYDLGIEDPRQRSRHFDEFSQPGPEAEPEIGDDWS